MTLRRLGCAAEVDFAATLAELTESFIQIEDGVLIPLKPYLPTGAMGNYRLTVLGPLGYAADLPFRLLPALEMINHDALHWSDDQEALHLLVETSAQIILELSQGAECVVTLLEKGEHSALYEARAGLQNPAAPLRFVWPRLGQEAVIVPLTVPVCRLRWLLALAPEQALTKEWRSSPVALPLEALEQSLEPLLFVDLFGGVAPDIEAELQLLDDDEEIVQTERARFQRGQPYARFDLRAFRDTLRHTATPVSRVMLCLFDQTIPGGQRCFPVLSIGRKFLVYGADALLQLEENRVILRLCWMHLCAYAAALCGVPLWHPGGPLELDIPDASMMSTPSL